MNWFSNTVVNGWFAAGLAVGAALRVVGGEVISLTTGLAFGIITVEMVRFAVWFFAKAG